MLSDSITIVSELLDKNYPGMEYNPEFAKIMEKRLKFTNKEKK
jgi:DNA modification methylase